MKRVVIVSGELILSKNPVEFVGLIISETAYLPKPWDYSAAAESRHLQESGWTLFHLSKSVKLTLAGGGIFGPDCGVSGFEEETVNCSFVYIALPVHA
jgi:hypothetical protein